MRCSYGNSAAAGAAVQLCVPLWLGFVPDDVAAEPAAAIARLSQRPVERSAGIGGRPRHGGVADQCEAEFLAGPLAEVAAHVALTGEGQVAAPRVQALALVEL